MKTPMPAAQPRRQADEACRPATGRTVCKWEVFALIKGIKDHLGLNDRDLTVLQVHLAVLPKELGEHSPKLSYKSVTALLERANGMDDSTFNRSERRLEERGLLRRKLSANGRRFPVYHPVTKTIVDAYGIDLQPLFERVSEFGRLHTVIEEERLARLNLITRISSWISEIRRKIRDSMGDLPESFLQVARELRRITRRKEVSIADLHVVEGRLHELEASYFEPETVDDGKAPCPSDNDVVPGDVHQNEWHIDSEEKNLKEETPERKVRFDRHVIKEVWDSCDTLRCFFDTQPATSHELAKILHQFSSFLSIGERVTMMAIETLGPLKTLQAFDYLSEKIHELRSPEAYLMSMMNSYRAGQRIAGGHVHPAV